MDDAAIFEMLGRYAEGLNTTPLEVLRSFIGFGVLFAFVLGGLLVLVLDRFFDHLFEGIFAFIRWLRSRKKNP